MSNIKYSKSISKMPINNADLDFYVESGLYNYTNRPLTVMTTAGHKRVLPPITPREKGRAGVEILAQFRHGRSSVPTSYAQSAIQACDIADRVSIFVPLEVLIKGPYFEAETGFTLAFDEHSAFMDQYNIRGAEFQKLALAEISRAYFGDEEHDPAPILILANSHDLSQKRLYVVINDRITSVRIAHDTNRPENMSIVFNGTEIRRSVVDFDFRNAAVAEKNIGGVIWIFGTDYSEVQSKLAAKLKHRSKLVSPDTIEDTITIRTTELTNSLETTKQALEQREREIKNLQSDKKHLQDELERSESAVKVSTKEREILRESEMKERERRYKDEERERDRAISRAEFEERLEELKYKQDLEHTKAESNKSAWWEQVLKWGLLAIQAIAGAASIYFTYKTKTATA